MERRNIPEQKFQRRIVASFNKAQLAAVYTWSEEYVTQTSPNFTKDFLRAVENAEFDEKGRKMDEKAKIRLRYAIKTIGVLMDKNEDLTQINNVIVWQVTPDELEIEVRRQPEANIDSALKRY